MEQSSKKSDATAPQAIHHELRTAENSAAYLLRKLETAKQSNPKLALLDVGAGSGTISVTLAKAIPEGRVVASDVKQDILVRAQAIAESEGIKNIEFQQADVYKLPFADGSFDVTHCHQVLCHLKAPSDALREMIRVTKPGGLVAVREGDLETECIWPEAPGLLKFHNMAANFMQLSGGSPKAGRQLLSWVLNAGVRRDQITMTFGTWYYNSEDEKRTWGRFIHI